MTEQSVVKSDDIMERVLLAGDLSKLQPEERVQYYGAVCKSLGLNPLTKPFEYISLNGKLTLYARRDCTDQLRRAHGINVSIASREMVNGCYVVTARAQDRDGRSDESIGAVSAETLKGDALANALMKAETKAKRRVTLSIVGLGWLDETETETIQGARPVVVTETGEVTEPPKEHWIKNPKVRAAFWRWTSQDLALSDQQVHEALDVQHVEEFAGTMLEAKARIEAWVAAQANQGEPGQDGEVEE